MLSSDPLWPSLLLRDETRGGKRRAAPRPRPPLGGCACERRKGNLRASIAARDEKGCGRRLAGARAGGCGRAPVGQCVVGQSEQGLCCAQFGCGLRTDRSRWVGTGSSLDGRTDCSLSHKCLPRHLFQELLVRKAIELAAPDLAKYFRTLLTSHKVTLKRASATLVHFRPPIRPPYNRHLHLPRTW